MKHLPKHLQPRWRYLAVELRTRPVTPLDRRSFQRECWFAAQNLVGDTGSATLDLSVIRFEHDGESGHAVVRARRGEVDGARAVLACVDSVDGADLGLRVRGTSGTIRAAVESHLGLANE